MASKHKLSKRNLWRVKFKDPIADGSNCWKTAHFKNETEADQALAKHVYIENCLKNNSPDWKRVYFGYETKTIKECFDFYQDQKLDDILNHLTEKRYQYVMKSFLECFDENTAVSHLRTTEKVIDGRKLVGLKIYKNHLKHLSRYTVNSNLRDLRAIFEYCREDDFISDEVIRKGDKYKDHELPATNKKKWSPNELAILENHPGISTFDREVISLYFFTGCRANEILGFNYLNRSKQLEWMHVDLKNNVMHVLEKKAKQRTEKYINDRVVAILKKWRKAGHEKPLPMGYDGLRNLISRVNLATGIDFTCHDLRRLYAQLARSEGGLQQAAHALGNSSKKVTNDSYAGITFEEKVKAGKSMEKAHSIWLESAQINKA